VDRASGECKTVVIDLEMCKVPKSRRFGYGLSMEIIQIGAVSLDENGEILDKFVSFVRPEYGFIDSAINRLTGIRQYDVKLLRFCGMYLPGLPNGWEVVLL
jgi:DNA polymerase III epsilon subunit-like protein